jgi:hypothetical protein
MIADQLYRVLHGVGTRTYIVCRDDLHGFVWDSDLGVAPRWVKPGSAMSHMGGSVEWKQLHHVDEVPPRLLAIMAKRGLTFTPGRVP